MTADALIDTNILVYHSKGDLRCTELIGGLLLSGKLYLSVVTKIEFLGWDGHLPELLPAWEALIAAANLLPIDDAVIEAAIKLRRKRRMKIGDCLIAATALARGLTVVTRNKVDFSGIESLRVENPFT